jgi:hypothetical protein
MHVLLEGGPSLKGRRSHSVSSFHGAAFTGQEQHHSYRTVLPQQDHGFTHILFLHLVILEFMIGFTTAERVHAQLPKALNL